MPSLRRLASFISSKFFWRPTYKKFVISVAVLLALVYFQSNNNLKIAPANGLVKFRCEQPVLPILLNALKEANISLILLDPNVLQSRRIKSTQDSVLFGIVEKFAERLDKFKPQLPTKWSLVKTAGIDYRLVRPQKRKSQFVNITTHYLFVSNELIVHVAVIFKRHDFFWIAGIDNSSVPHEYLPKLDYGVPFPMAVDTFEYAGASIEISSFCIPPDLDYYYWQIRYAHFHECHYEDVVYPFLVKYPWVKASVVKEQKKALGEIMRIAKKLRIPAMIFCGTLLGWYRQCDYIPSSQDIDVGVMIDDYKRELIHELFRSKVITPGGRLGTLNLGIEFRVRTKGNFWMDIFYLYSRQPDVIAAYMYSNGRNFRTVYPKITKICSVELFEVLTFIPCNYDEIVAADYGQDQWLHPNTGSVYPNINMYVENTYNGSDALYMEHWYSSLRCAQPNEMWGCDQMPKEVIDSTLYKTDIETLKKDDVISKMNETTG